MGLISGSVSVTRCRVSSLPDEVDFDSSGFVEIPPSSSIRERVGFLPMEPGEDYQIGQHRWAFRVRIDRMRPDPTAVRERVKEMVRGERKSTGEIFVSPRKVRAFRQEAQEDVMMRTTPRSKLIECCLDRDSLWIGNTSNAELGIVLTLLQSVGVTADLRTPWLDRGDEDPGSDAVEAKEEWQSLLGCRFLKSLLRDTDLMVEVEKGSVRLATTDAWVTLSGGVMPELLRFVQKGAEILSAKLQGVEYSFRFDAMDYRVSSLRMENEAHFHWQDMLDERLEKIEALFDLLDDKYTRWISHLSSPAGP